MTCQTCGCTCERCRDPNVLRRRPIASHRYAHCHLCRTPHCYDHFCTNPAHKDSWIPDEEPHSLTTDAAKEKEKPVCSSDNSLTSADLKLVRVEIDAAIKAAKAADLPRVTPLPLDAAAERDKEREHEAAIHRRECDCATARLETIGRASDAWVREFRPAIATLSALFGVCFVAYQIRVANAPVPPPQPPKTAEQMFGMGERK